MRRGEAWKPLRERGGWMKLSEKAVFYVLLDRADNADCSIPAWMTPSLLQLAEACGCSSSTVKLALNHLEQHKWLSRESKPNAGRGHKASYRLDGGQPCDCPKPAKRADSRPFNGEKRADSRPPKRADSHPEKRRSDTVSDEGINEGEDRKGWPAGTNGASANLWPPVRIPGVRGPVPDDGATRRALHVLADVLGPVEVIEIMEAK